MITANKLQSAYNCLYCCMRNYIWEFETVEALADLEIETYQSFPDMKNLDKKLSNLKKRITSTDAYREDDELRQSFDDFESSIHEDTDLYASIKTFKEVVAV